MIENNEIKQLEKKPDNKVVKKSSVNVLESPKTRDFLLKLYNECKKLNGNIIKLYSDRKHNQTKNVDTFWNYMNKDNKSSKSKGVRRTRSEVHLNLQGMSKSNLDLKDLKKSESELTTGQVHEGHYYHLACVISPDMANSSINYNKNMKSNEQLSKPFPKPRDLNKALSEEITNISSVKSYVSQDSSTSSEKSIKANISERKSYIFKEKYTLTNEFDDTLCDLDEDMRTDSSELSIDDPNVNFNDIKSPQSNSNYVTANDQNNHVGVKGIDEKNKDSLKISSSLELPPNPSFVDYDMSDLSLRIDPPRSTEILKESSNEEIFAENQSTINRFITVFEKQFPQRFLLHPPPKNDNYYEKERKDSFSKFSSSLTVNCTKKSVDFNENSNFFNPFKPPICQTLKYNGCFNTNNNNLIENNNDEEVNKVKINNSTSDFPNKNVEFNDKDKNIDLSNEEYKRIAPLQQLLQHSRTSEQMNDVIVHQQRENETSPTFNSCIEKQRQKKIARQQEQHQKAKDMAVEAARLRKERQSEMQSFDSFDSSRIIEKLFTNNQDDNYPEYSLFDAVHYNFKNKKPRKSKPLVQSTITGILPEAPPVEPEPPKSPLTTEKFRNQPFQIEKNLSHKKKFTLEEIAKYEPINISIPPVKSNKVIEDEILKIDNRLPIVFNKNNNENDKTVLKEINSCSSYSSSITSSETISSLSESSSSSSSLSIKKKLKSKKPQINEFYKEISLKSNNNQRMKDTEEDQDNHKTSTSFNTMKKLDYTISNEIIIREIDNEGNLEISAKRNKQCNDMNVGTEDNDDEDRFKEIMTKNNFSARNFSNTQRFIGNKSECIDCHLNYQTKYKDNVLDHILPITINIPIPDVSLSSFVQELNIQLHSLADTVDILLNRMDVLEMNILDCSKYFVYR